MLYHLNKPFLSDNSLMYCILQADIQTKTALTQWGANLRQAEQFTFSIPLMGGSGSGPPKSNRLVRQKNDGQHEISKH